tara:strand:- start:2852 stop:3490 length:639 start_codon:yes stop_codon:yes gene_type:complete
MAFLQLRKKHNLSTKDNDRGIDVQLLEDPSDCNPKVNKYKKTEFEVNCTNIGGDYTTEDSGSFILYHDKPFKLTCTEYLMRKLYPFSKGDCIKIVMYQDGENINYHIKPSKIEWDKEPEEIKTVNESKYGYDSVKERDTDRRLDILWGMAFNNATRLAASIPLHEDEGDIKSRVQTIESIMPKMFKIAQGLDSVLKKQDAEKRKDDTSDLPF